MGCGQAGCSRGGRDAGFTDAYKHEATPSRATGLLTLPILQAIYTVALKQHVLLWKPGASTLKSWRMRPPEVSIVNIFSCDSDNIRVRV